MESSSGAIALGWRRWLQGTVVHDITNLISYPACAFLTDNPTGIIVELQKRFCYADLESAFGHMGIIKQASIYMKLQVLS